jgi:hypothetical protein
VGQLGRCTCTNILVVAGVGGCWEWMGMRGTSDDAFGCWEEDGKGLGCIGWVSDKQ